MDISTRYSTTSGKDFIIKFSYNERIGERDTADKFVRNITILDAHSNMQVSVPVQADKFSTFENFTSFGSYSAINYQGARGAAIEGLRAKIITRIEDALEKLG